MTPGPDAEGSHHRGDTTMKTFAAAALAASLGFAALAPVSAEAASIPRGTSADQRVKTVVYNENDVVSLRGHYGYQTTVSFATYEKIQNISIGDSVSWQVVPNAAGNLLFLKPVEDNATTNMTVITDRRIYNFELTSGQAFGPRDNSITYMMKFLYPNDNVLSYEYDTDDAPAVSLGGPYAPRTQIDSAGLRSVGTPRDLNFDYTFKGEEEIAPTTVFDNGEFTYFRFREMGDLPAVFTVDRDRNESVVNYQIEDGYMVVQSVARQFTLRHGEDEACVFNDSFNDRQSLFSNASQG